MAKEQKQPKEQKEKKAKAADEKSVVTKTVEVKIPARLKEKYFTDK